MPFPKQIKEAARVLFHDPSPVTRREVMERARQSFGTQGEELVYAALGAMQRSHRVSERATVTRQGTLIFAPDTPARIRVRAWEEAGHPSAPVPKKLPRPALSVDELRAINRANAAYSRARKRAAAMAAGTYRPRGRPRKIG